MNGDLEYSDLPSYNALSIMETASTIDPRPLVFEAIVASWISNIGAIEERVARIRAQTKTWVKGSPPQEWSFESPLNSWARQGCRNQPGWTSPENGLRCYPNPGLIADALVTVPGHTAVAVEIKHANCATGSKHPHKINEDTEKLSTLTSALGLQIVALFETYDLESCSSLASWLNRVHIWNVPTPMVYCREILGSGKMLVKGWPLPS